MNKITPDRSFDQLTSPTPYATAHFIKEIGRGVKGARSLSSNDAQDLFSAIIARRVSDLELGAILLAMRIKGESVAEISGFLTAAEASFPALQAPASAYLPIVIPSYNGARRAANLTPLLALLLARAGAPVLIHGVLHDPGRVTTAEILAELGVTPCTTPAQVSKQFSVSLPAFISIANLAPRLSELLEIRQTLGLRNSTHTLVKMMQPFAQAALRLTSYTHPEYAAMLTDYFSNVADPERGGVFLMRGTEGETVASIKKVQQIDWFHDGRQETLIHAQPGTDLTLPIPPDAAGTAQWIRQVLDGAEPVPDNIATQLRLCLMAAKKSDRMNKVD